MKRTPIWRWAAVACHLSALLAPGAWLYFVRHAGTSFRWAGFTGRNLLVCLVLSLLPTALFFLAQLLQRRRPVLPPLPPGSCRLAVHPVRQLEPLERRPGGPSPDHGAAPDSASRCPHGGHLCPFAAPVSSPLRPAPQVDRPSQQRGPMEPRNSGRSHKQSRLLPLSHWQKFPHPRFPLQTAHSYSILQNFFRLTKLPLRNRMQL